MDTGFNSSDDKGIIACNKVKSESKDTKIDYNEMGINEFRTCIINLFKSKFYNQGLREYALYMYLNTFKINLKNFFIECNNYSNGMRVDFKKETPSGKLRLAFNCIFDIGSDYENDTCTIFQIIGDKNLLYELVEEVSLSKYLDYIEFEKYFRIDEKFYLGY